MAKSQASLKALLGKDVLVKDSERQLRALADAIPLIVWTANPNGELDYCNRQWEIYTGLSAAETHGWGWAPVIHPDDLQPCIDRWTQAFTTGEPYEIEYRFKRASDGSYRWRLRGLFNGPRQPQVQSLFMESVWEKSCYSLLSGW